jgi:hypothetical protein
MLQAEFPAVQLIANPTNRGYTAPMNQALQKGRGLYRMQLNPDTLIHPGMFDTLLDFMESHPSVGICGPKVLNRDGSLQKSCRRGDSRPWAVISYFLGLSRLFPRSRFFGRYHQNHLPEDEINPVDGVSGSCMLIRKDVLEAIGFLDEQFFAYQEDADFCLRARKAGWQVYYVPSAQITHFGGQGGSRVQPYQAVVEWHRSYFLYYRKHFARDYFFLFNGLYYGLMALKLAAALLTNALRREKFAGPLRN